MMAEIIRRRMKTYSSVPSEKTVSGESAVFRREAVMTGKLAGVRTAIGGTEENKGDGRPFPFSLSGSKRGKGGTDFFVKSGVCEVFCLTSDGRLAIISMLWCVNTQDAVRRCSLMAK